MPDPSTKIQTAQWRPRGLPLALPNFSPAPIVLPEHCEVTATLGQHQGIDGQTYLIRLRVRLPLHWNRRFYFEGGGGSEGELGPAVGFLARSLPTALERGYAVVAQDGGHDNAVNADPERGGTLSFGFDPEARADYGGAALERVTRTAQALVRAYYKMPAQRSYFVGCSKGGQEGMVAAQRHPPLFDGIVANAPGFALPRAAIAEAWDTQSFASLVETPGEETLEPSRLPTAFSDAQFARVRDSILAACDADDGVRDGITAAFGSCTWARIEPELRRRVCATDAGGGCLSERQVEVLRRVLGGPKDSMGHALYADWPVDAGIGTSGWRFWKIGSEGAAFPGINATLGSLSLASVFTTPPTAVRPDPQSALNFSLHFSFDRDAAKIYDVTGDFKRSSWADISARSPDLARYRDRGGRMIIVHGASDPVFSLNDTVAWYQEVDRLNHGRAARFVRLFPVPGMTHCLGGPSTDQFDALEALVGWVERGQTPERIIAKAGPDTPWPGRTRPLCPFPQSARYSGSGNIEDAANFRCE